MQLARSRRRFAAGDGDGHAAALGEFDGIAGEIEQYLFEAQRIAVQGQLHQVRRDVQTECQAFFGGTLCDQTVDVLEQATQPEGGFFQCELLGFDLRDIEDVVDDAQQALRGLCHFAQLVGLPGIHGVTFGQIGHADDGIHRGSQFAWLMLARKLLLARLADSASCLA